MYTLLIIFVIFIAILWATGLHAKIVQSLFDMFTTADTAKTGGGAGNTIDRSAEILEMFSVWEEKSIIPKHLYKGKPPTIETVKNALAHYAHGGYYYDDYGEDSKEDIKEDSKEDSDEVGKVSSEERDYSDPQSSLPYMRDININGKPKKYLQITGLLSRKPEVHTKYALEGNRLIKEHFRDGEPLLLSLDGNSGGKYGPMIAALAPIFNTARKDLWYSSKVPQEPRIAPGEYYEESSSRIYCTKDVLKPSRIEVLIGDTASAGETTTICLKTLQKDNADNGGPEVIFYGYQTLGYTTQIGWGTLSTGTQFEYPSGMMTDKWQNDYSDGIKPDIEMKKTP
jgi:hypothetical protein